MKPTKKTLKAIKKIEKKVAEVCDTNTELSKIQEIEQKASKVYKDGLNEKDAPQPTSREIQIKLSFGQNSPSLKHQLQEQGFTLSKGVLKDAENIRIDLFALNQAGILSSKQLWKCFSKLSKQIGKMVVNS